MQQLHQKIEYLQTGFVKEKETEMNRQLREKVAVIEEKQSLAHAETTKQLYEEIQASLKNRFKDEERARHMRLREKLELDFAKKLAVKESEFAQMLAAERKEASKVNLKNVALEEELRTLEREREHLVVDKENLLRI